MQPRTHARVDAVGADERVGRGGPRGADDAIAQLHADAVLRLLEARDGGARADAVRAEALADGVEQQQLQLAAMDRDLRPAVAGGAPARLGADAVAEAVEVHELLPVGDAGRLDGLTEAELVEFAHRVRQQVDPAPSGCTARADSITSTSRPAA